MSHVSPGLFATEPDNFCPLCFHRKCALVALDDVKTYLNEEGGQIAVSTTTTTKLPKIYFFLTCCQWTKIEIASFLTYLRYCYAPGF